MHRRGRRDAEVVHLVEVTDEEFRRTMFHVDFLSGFDGVEEANTGFAIPYDIWG